MLLSRVNSGPSAIHRKLYIDPRDRLLWKNAKRLYLYFSSYSGNMACFLK